MTHVRRTLREGVKERLEGLALSGETLSVYTNRVKEIHPDKLPAAVIVTEDETSERYAKPGSLQRTIRCSVVVMLDADRANDIDDELDDWSELVEMRLREVPVGGAQAFTLVSTALDIPDPEEGGATWIGFLILEYEATVFG